MSNLSKEDIAFFRNVGPDFEASVRNTLPLDRQMQIGLDHELNEMPIEKLSAIVMDATIRLDGYTPDNSKVDQLDVLILLSALLKLSTEARAVILRRVEAFRSLQESN